MTASRDCQSTHAHLTREPRGASSTQCKCVCKLDRARLFARTVLSFVYLVFTAPPALTRSLMSAPPFTAEQLAWLQRRLPGGQLAAFGGGASSSTTPDPPPTVPTSSAHPEAATATGTATGTATDTATTSAGGPGTYVRRYIAEGFGQ